MKQADGLRITVMFHYLLAGIFLMLGVLHLLYYSYYRKQHVHLTFAVTMLLCAVHHWVYDLGINTPDPFASQLYIYIGEQTVSLYIILLLATLYQYLERRLSLVFWLLSMAFMGATLLTGVLPYPKVLDAIYSTTSILLYVDGMRIGIDALRRKQANARLILYAAASLAFFLLARVGGTYLLGQYQADWVWNWDSITIGLFYLCAPLAISALLARDNARTNRDLQDQLNEVERLSAEKQQLLAGQNETLEQQVARRTAKLNQSLQNLRETQTQLIQREKMASLGELTAGIAHEIQNPLNFVNNFADISTELLDELNQEQARPAADRDPGLETELLGDIRQNISKISQHGQRAANIVRGMLQHSRSSNGEKEKTDLNALGDEYLRLSYHGLRAKDQEQFDRGGGPGSIQRHAPHQPRPPARTNRCGQSGCGTSIAKPV